MYEIPYLLPSIYHVDQFLENNGSLYDQTKMHLELGLPVALHFEKFGNSISKFQKIRKLNLDAANDLSYKCAKY